MPGYEDDETDRNDDEDDAGDADDGADAESVAVDDRGIFDPIFGAGADSKVIRRRRTKQGSLQRLVWRHGKRIVEALLLCVGS